ncbi:hypothetical protein BX600DRAFT_507030 [Xylariales sp. PMI_506]|nr:hypothetical protein BX600DRAFT_507030 [Xylariales sp. PMI_506]
MKGSICSQCRMALRQRLRATSSAPHLRRSAVQSSPSSNEARALFSSSSFWSPSKEHPDPSPRDILSKPTWSVRSLLPPASQTSRESVAGEKLESRGSNETTGEMNPDDVITPSTLRHLLRLSALPPPASPAEEKDLLHTLRSQLHFVRSIQFVDTAGVAPLQSIRDETAAGRSEQTIGFEALRAALDQEDVVGHSKRPRRRREKLGPTAMEGHSERAKRTNASEMGKADGSDVVEGWDVLAGASMKAGRYFVVRSGKGSTSEGPATS